MVLVRYESRTVGEGLVRVAMVVPLVLPIVEGFVG